MDRNYDITTFIWKCLYFNKTYSSQFWWHYQNSNIIKKTFKDSKKVKRIRNYVLKCNLYLYFLAQQNLLIFGEKILSGELVSRNLHIFLDFLWVMHNCAKCHQCRIYKTYLREGSLYGLPNPWAALKKRPIVNKVKIV